MYKETKKVLLFFLKQIKDGLFGALSFTESVVNKNPQNFLRRTEMVLNYKKCTGCLDCEKLCPVQAINIECENEKLAKMEIDYGSCTYCGYCIDICEEKALSYIEFNIKKKSSIGYLRNELKTEISTINRPSFYIEPREP